MLVYIFPGQGAQKEGMGKELFDQISEFSAIEEDINQLLGYSVRDFCLNATGDDFNNTKYVQPCLYLVNALHYYDLINKGQRPNVVAGHSLGEYNALLAAGAFDLITGLKLVRRRGQLMSQIRNGTMAAVIGLEPDAIGDVVKAHGLQNIDFANYNSPMQTVISGNSGEIETAKTLLVEAGAKMCVPLRVSGAFHSRYMKEISHGFSRYLDNFSFNQLEIPVISNVTARPYPNVDHDHAIKSLLVRQMSEPVQWNMSIQLLLTEGATNFIEIGGANILTPLVRQIKSCVAA